MTASPLTKSRFDDLYADVAALETPDLEKFFFQIATVLATRKNSNLNFQEAVLLKKISAGYPISLKKRYAELSEQPQLSENEAAELVELADKFEELDAARLKSVLELAQIRQVSPTFFLEKMSANSVKNPWQF